MSRDIGFASQVPSLPGGAGTVGGLGETFAPDLATGSGTFSVPLDLPHGPNDISPRLTLRYDTGSPNGPFGMGWTVPLPRLLRSTMRGRPGYDAADTIVLEGSGPLVRLPDGGLRPEVDTGEWRVETEGDGFRVTDRAGTRYRLGASADSRIPGVGDQAWAWLLHEIEDNLGTTARFRWRAAGTQRYLEQVDYGQYSVRLRYEPRPDVLRFGRGGFMLRTDERCAAVELHLAGAATTMLRRWELSYTQAEVNGASLLSSITLVGVAADGSELVAEPLRLGYQRPGAVRLARVTATDDGGAPPGLDGRGRVELVDVDGDGLPDVLQIPASGHARVWPNLAGRWGRPRVIGEATQLSPVSARAALVDLDGDGLADLVRADQPLSGYQPRTATGLDRPVRWSRAPAVALMDTRCRLADLDGDGIPDLLWSSGSSMLLAHRRDGDGWEARPTVIPARPAGPPTDLRDPRVDTADMTGDGTPDLVRVDGAGVTYWPYLGHGLFGEAVQMHAAPTLPFDLDPSRLHVVDVDGDGCADVLWIDDGELRWWPNHGGDRFGPARRVAHLPTGAMSDVRVADLLGLGSPSLCWSAPLPSGRAAWFALDLFGGVKPGLLATIDTSTGRRVEIGYGTSAGESARDAGTGERWPSQHPVVLPVVAQITTADAVTSQQDTTRYRYHLGRYDGVLREVCGFGRVEEIEVGDEHVPTLVTTRWFANGARPDGGEPTTVEERRRARAIRGRMTAQERHDEHGSRFDRTEHTWEVADADVAGVVVPRLRRTVTAWFEGNDEPVSWIETEQTSFDRHGNVQESVERSHRADDPGGAFVLRSRLTYADDPNGRFRQRVSRIVQDNGAGAILADTVTDYDGQTTGQLGPHGLVTRRAALAITDAQAAEVYGTDQPDMAALGYVRRSGSDGWWIQLGHYERVEDADGVRGVITGPLGGVTRLDYDPTGCYPARVVDAVGNVLTAVFDPRCYQPTTLTDPSGATSTARFDALARLVAVVEPGDHYDEPTTSYEYRTASLPIEVVVQRRTGAGTAPVVERQILDGAGRLLQRRGVDELGEVVDISNFYGARGMLVRSELPHRPSDPPTLHNSVHYDALARPVRTTRADGAQAHVRYLPGAVEEIDEEGRRTRRTVDAAGRTVRTEQFLDAGVATSTDRLDVKGAVVEHVDAAGAATRFTYDLLGRLLRVGRPEGTQVGVLDAAGNTVEARIGAVRVYRRFDLAGRLLEVRHGQPVAAPVVRCTYHDTGTPPPDAGAHTAGGRLVRVDDEGGSTVVDYDHRGRIATKIMTPTGHGTVRVDLTHRSDGRVETVSVRRGPETLAATSYRYDRRARLAAIEGYVDEIGYDLLGRRVQTRYSNGVTSSEEHDDATGWRRSSRLAGPDGVLREVGYTHDAVGNVSAIASPDPARAWDYDYDELHRLVRASGEAGVWEYAYDLAGNLTSSSDGGAFTYGQAGAASTCLTGVGTDSYGYDALGHLRSAPWGVHTVDAEGRLRRIDFTGGGYQELTYGHTGALVARRVVDADGGTRETLTPDDLLSIEDGVDVVQISDGVRIVARVRAGTTTWLHHDHLGSLVSATDAAGAEVARIDYGPYGQVLRRTGAPTGTAGFATSDAVTADLVLLGTRWYCPAIGRFISPDSLIGDASDPLAWNVYAYCRGNPTSYVDPSGRSFWKVFGVIAAAVVITALLVTVSVLTFGAATPAAALLAKTLVVATLAGMAGGGVIGGIAAAKAGGNLGDVAFGVLVGAAIGGAAAFGAVFAGAAVAGGLGKLGVTGIAKGAIVGSVSGAVNGAAMGFAAGFAGGRNNGFTDVMEKVLVGALIGAAVGGALGAASGVPKPEGTLKQDFVDKFAKPDIPSTAPPDGVANAPGSVLAGSPVPVNSVPDAFTSTFSGMVGKAGAVSAPHLAHATAGFTGSVVTQTVVVDLTAAGVAGWWDDLQHYLRTHEVDLGPH